VGVERVRDKGGVSSVGEGNAKGEEDGTAGDSLQNRGLGEAYT